MQSCHSASEWQNALVIFRHMEHHRFFDCELRCLFLQKMFPHSKLIELLIKMVKKNKLNFKTDVQGIDHMNFQNRCEKIDLDVLFLKNYSSMSISGQTMNPSIPSRGGCHRHVEPPTYFPKAG